MIWSNSNFLCLLLVGGVVLSSGLSLGCNRLAGSKTDQAAIIAEVNGEAVKLSDFQQHIRQISDFLDEDVEGKVRSQLFDEFIKERALAQEARKNNLTVAEKPAAPAEGLQTATSADVTEAVPENDQPQPTEEARRLVEKYQHEVVLKDLTVTPEEIDAYYQQNRVRFQRQNGFFLRDIRVADRAQAEQLYRQLTKLNGDFEALAREYSLSPTAAQGGLRYYEGGQLPAVFEKVVHDLKPGQVSTIVSTEYGFHLFRLEQRAAPLTLAEAEAQIRQELLSAKSQALLEADARRVLAATRIKIYPTRLGFRYTGNFTND